jgi:hypothetical protein
MGWRKGSPRLTQPPPQKLSAPMSTIEQQAQERGLAGLFRGGKQCDGVHRNQAVPDPQNRLLVFL